MNTKAAGVLACLWVNICAALVFGRPVCAQESPETSDPRLQPPFVNLITAKPVSASERVFTGVIAAKVESNLGFRVAGKLIERLVDVGQEVHAGQPLMRIDPTDLQLALGARRDAVAAARAHAIQMSADERRFANLAATGAIPVQRYDQAKAAADTARAQLAVAEAEAKVAENQAAYSALVADAAGTVTQTLGEPGQVVFAGQTVVKLAHSGPREAVIALPETLRPAIDSKARAQLYGREGHSFPARLRQLSDAADPQTRTYEARYVLDGEAAAAPLGATVTLHLAGAAVQPELEVPLGAVLDDGRQVGVWVFDGATSTVRFHTVSLVRVTSETAVITGLQTGTHIVALGAHLLHEGEQVRTATTGHE